MRQHALVGRAALGAAGLQHRGMEPPTVLVGAFKVKVRDAVLGPVRPVAQHEGMGGARIEPDVQHVEDLFIILRIGDAIQHLFLESLHIPDIRALGFERRDDAGVDGVVAQQEVGIGRARALLDEAGQRHAPGALAAQHPIRARLDHRIKPVAPGLRRPFDQIVDRGQRAGADRVAIGAHAVVELFVDGHEPLRRVAIDQRRFRAPAMRIAVLDLALGEQGPRIGQLLDDADIGRAVLAVGQDDRLAAKDRQVGAVRPVGFDVIGHRQAIFQAKLIVVVAVAGRGVDKARACVLGDMVTGEHGDVVIPFAVRAFDAPEGVGENKTAKQAGGDWRNECKLSNARRFEHLLR